MKVSLGTVEIDDATRKAVRRAKGGKGLATRAECKEFLVQRLESTVITGMVNQPEASSVPQGPVDGGETYGADLPQSTYQPSGLPGEGLPEPTESGDTL